MRKFLFAVFALLITANAWSLTITCKDRADARCTIDPKFIKTQKCKDITKQSSNSYLYLDMDSLRKCSKQLHTFLEKMQCSTNHIQAIGTTDGYIWYCDNDINITLTYANEKTDNWSYAQKRCVGSSGDWKNGQCTCDQDKIPGTTLQNGECICTDKTNQKYFNKLYTGCEMLKNGAKLVRDNSTISGILNEDGADTWDIASIDRANSCDITGGDRQGNKCNCESRLNLEPNASEYYCNCKAGTDYKNPLYKNEGCISITEISGYSAVNFAQDIHTDTEPHVEAEQPKPQEPVIDETAPEVAAPKPTATELEEKLKTAQDALKTAKEKENSWANRALGATTTAATSLGAMQLAEGIAEKKADEEAEKQMRNYITTMKCEYGGGKHVDFGVEETLPGGNELLDYYTEYKQLADNLKTTKAALGLGAGIESEVLYDRAQSGLYQYANTGKTGGGETSLFRALTDSESEDATAWSEQKETASKKLKVGGGVAAGGAAVGVIGNAAINTDMIQNIKDAFKKD